MKSKAPNVPLPEPPSLALGSREVNPLNPRSLSPEAKAKLTALLTEFGDLSGFVYNVRTSRLVGGHQRQSALPAESPIVITDRLPAPNAQGTVARGYVEVNGERHTYREVDWTEDREKVAMIAANKAGQLATWDEPQLAALADSIAADQRHLTGFDDQELAALIATLSGEDPSKLKDVKVETPPKMAWLLVAVPLVSFGEISPLAEQAALIPGSIVETAVSDLGAPAQE